MVSSLDLLIPLVLKVRCFTSTWIYAFLRVIAIICLADSVVPCASLLVFIVVDRPRRELALA